MNVERTPRSLRVSDEPKKYILTPELSDRMAEKVMSDMTQGMIERGLRAVLDEIYECESGAKGFNQGGWTESDIPRLVELFQKAACDGRGTNIAV